MIGALICSLVLDHLLLLRTRAKALCACVCACVCCLAFVANCLLMVWA